MNTLGCLKNRKLFFTVLDTRKSKVKVPADLVPSESLLPSIHGLFSVHVCGERGICLSLLVVIQSLSCVRLFATP